MQNVAPKRSLTQRSFNWLFIALIVGLLGVLLFVIGVTLTSIEIVVPSNPGYQTYVFIRTALMVVGGLLTLVAVAVALRAITWRVDNELAIVVGDELTKHLDKSYVFIRNVSQFGLGYIDAVLIGPPGVLVFRITNRTGIFFNEGSRWMQQTDKATWKPLDWSPSLEAVEDVKKLREYLARRKLGDVPVFAVVVFNQDHPLVQLTSQQPLVTPVYLNEISYALADTYFSQKRIDLETRQQLVRILYQ